MGYNMSAPVPATETVGYSPKFVWSTTVATVVGVLLAIITWVTGNVELLGLSPVWSGLLLAILIPVSVGVTAFQAPPGVVVNKNSADPRL
jgi:hypothetical protein